MPRQNAAAHGVRAAGYLLAVLLIPAGMSSASEAPLSVTPSDPVTERGSPAHSADAEAVPKHGASSPPEKRKSILEEVPVDANLETSGTGLLARTDRLSGNWLGSRSALERAGVGFELFYSADVFTNTKGGIDTSGATVYRGLFDMAITLDTAEAGLWDNGTFLLNFQQIHGCDISARYVGDIQALNNADAPDRTQLAEYWYEHVLPDAGLRLKIGKMDANADFAYVDYGLEFIHSSAGFHPTIPLPTYPDPALGVVVFFEPADWIYVGGGVYDGQGRGDQSGFESALHSPNESFTIFELGVRPEWQAGGRVIPGRYYVGGWYHSGPFEIFATFDEEEETIEIHPGNAGLYLAMEQLVFHEHPLEQEDLQGLGVFFQFGWAPSEYNEISQYYGAGAQYVGSFRRAMRTSRASGCFTSASVATSSRWRNATRRQRWSFSMDTV
jgi:carbohydrate-selective porin OprB